MIKARKLTKKVEIWTTTIVPDGVGGNITSKALTTTRWCGIEDVGGNSYQSDAGITDFTNTFKFTFRYDKNFKINPKANFLKYDGLDYSILDVKTKGFKHVEQICTAKQIFGLD